MCPPPPAAERSTSNVEKFVFIPIQLIFIFNHESCGFLYLHYATQSPSNVLLRCENNHWGAGPASKQGQWNRYNCLFMENDCRVFRIAVPSSLYGGDGGSWCRCPRAPSKGARPLQHVFALCWPTCVTDSLGKQNPALLQLRAVDALSDHTRGASQDFQHKLIRKLCRWKHNRRMTLLEHFCLAIRLCLQQVALQKGDQMVFHVRNKTTAEMLPIR